MIEDFKYINMLPPVTLTLLILGLCVVLFFAYLRFSVPVSLSTRIFLGFLRVSVLALIVFLILDPYWNQERDKEWVGVLVDTSSSMGVVDKGEGTSRVGLLRNYFQEDDYWRKMLNKEETALYSFDIKTKKQDNLTLLGVQGSESNLISALKQIDRLYSDDSELLGWVLFSDGNATDLFKDKETIFSELSFPWVAIGMGDKEAVSNTSIQEVVVPDFVFIDEIFPVKTLWSSVSPSANATRLELYVDGSLKLEQEVDLSSESKELDLSILDPGVHYIDLKLISLEGEATDEDNNMRVWLEARKRLINVFYIESFYKDENKFKIALEKDPNIQVTFASSLQGFAKQEAVPFIKDPLYGFPKSKQELFQYDVVILSDVKRSLLTDEQIQWIEALVKNEGGALVMIGGVDSFGDGGYLGTEIEKMLPVEISEEYKKDIFLRAQGTVENKFKPVISEGAYDHPILQLVDNESENEALWGSVPDLGGYNYVGRLKPAATSILKHPEDLSTFGPRVILASQNYGNGKVLAFTSDVTYNWGQWFQDWQGNQEEWLFSEFWINTTKWLTENRLKKKINPIQIQLFPAFVEESRDLNVSLILPENEGRSDNTRLHLELFKGEERLSIKEYSVLEVDQEIKQQFDGLSEGDYLFRVHYLKPNSVPQIIEKHFSVQASRLEILHMEKDEVLLKSLAKTTEGQYLDFSEMSRFEQALSQLRLVHLREASKPFWNQWWILGLILFLLTLDWFIRKNKGLE